MALIHVATDNNGGVQPVGTGTANTALPVTTTSASMGGTAANPTFVTNGQGTPTQTTITLVANTAQTIISANANIRGARILNWITAPIYLANGTTGTPVSGAPSDYIPAAAAGPIPAQFEFPYAPVAGVRAVCASAGTLTVETW